MRYAIFTEGLGTGQVMFREFDSDEAVEAWADQNQCMWFNLRDVRDAIRTHELIKSDLIIKTSENNVKLRQLYSALTQLA